MVQVELWNHVLVQLTVVLDIPIHRIYFGSRLMEAFNQCERPVGDNKASSSFSPGRVPFCSKGESP